MVKDAVAWLPVLTAVGSWSNLIESASSSRSESLMVEIVKVLDVSPDAKVSVVLEGE